jgi:lipoprotein-anchoring transpeptidase ErfK/SrfK
MWEDGSYGCVNMTTAAAKWLYNWPDLGTTVIVVN